MLEFALKLIPRSRNEPIFYTPFRVQQEYNSLLVNASKSLPRWAAHTRIGNVWEYPPRARVKHALYKSFENEEFVALLKILIASRRLHYQIKRSLKTKFVYMFSSHQHR